MTSSAWTVHPHGVLKQHESNLWSVTGNLPRTPLNRRMAIVRLGDGSLLVHNAICVDDPTLEQIKTLGEPRWLIVPNGYHRMDCGAFKARFPQVKVLAPAQSIARVREKVAVDGDYSGMPTDPSVRAEPLDGFKSGEAAFVVQSGARASVIVTDAIFNVPHQPGFGGFVLKLLGSSGGPRVTAFAKLTSVSDKAALRGHLLRLAAVPNMQRLIVGHGDIVESNAAAVLQSVAQNTV